MNNMLIKSQDEMFTGYVKYIGIGQRQDNGLIGDKLKELLYKEKMTSEDLIKEVGNSYRDNIKRVLDNQEIPKPKLIELITSKLDVDNDYFVETELQNIIVTDNNIVIAKYDTNKRALEVKQELDKYMFECHKKSTPITIEIPKE